MALRLYNSLDRTEEEFEPQNKGSVSVYTCGPTVYDYVTIGNWRTYTLGDIVNRVLSWNGYTPLYIMNITDVGHLTGDNEGDASTGVDRMEKAKKREGKTAWEIAQFYADDFKAGYRKLNLTEPKMFCKATDHIPEQIDLVSQLLEKGLAYHISDGVYFDTIAYEAKGYVYGELSNLKNIKEGARVEINPEKKNPRDFALWKFSPTNEKRDMEWDSPWGVGFPGWHIECSAMSMKYLGPQLDVHIGGEDLKSTHHPNEIAQSQGATDKVPFVKYWIHGAFLQVDGGRMGKSMGNAYTLADLEKKGVNPLALRYFYMTSHYRSPLNFTWEALESSSHALLKLQRECYTLAKDDSQSDEGYKSKFTTAINDDFNMPKALAVAWELVKDTSIPSGIKRATLVDFDAIFGFNLAVYVEESIPQEVVAIAKEREEARKAKDWAQSDLLRTKITDLGYEVKDTEHGSEITKI